MFSISDELRLHITSHLQPSSHKRRKLLILLHGWKCSMTFNVSRIEAVISTCCSRQSNLSLVPRHIMLERWCGRLCLSVTVCQRPYSRQGSFTQRLPGNKRRETTGLRSGVAIRHPHWQHKGCQCGLYQVSWQILLGGQIEVTLYSGSAGQASLHTFGDELTMQPSNSWVVKGSDLWKNSTNHAIMEEDSNCLLCSIVIVLKSLWSVQVSLIFSNYWSLPRLYQTILWCNDWERNTRIMCNELRI